MEESIEDLLTRWGMPADVVTFKNNGIEVCHLNNLSDDNLKELCSHMGTRINLKKCLSEYNDAQIDEDFKNLYPGKEKEFENKWQKFFYKLIELKKSEIRTDDCKEKLLTSLSSMTDDEHKIPSQLSLMIHLVPPKGRSSQKKKFSIQECMDSLIIIVENPGDLTKTIEDQKIKAKKFPVQPYIILLGSLQDVKQLYLVMDEIRVTEGVVLFDVAHNFGVRVDQAKNARAFFY
ncbi:unnamed protein product [Diatraea saccharalis]|uniref:Uncharacterized protein n=1 Tax=Diatraea saccharalis TaxID=40085 RepID=A0A9N9WFQ8_9NEOP|nr:unnamed protein product [Diatraea saccharalis]